MSQTRSSFSYMECESQSLPRQQNQIFLENRRTQNQVSWREKNPNFAKLRLVYKPRMLGNSDLSRKEHLFFGKLYSSRTTSAFVNPLVCDKRVLILDGRTSKSFLPCQTTQSSSKIQRCVSYFGQTWSCSIWYKVKSVWIKLLSVILMKRKSFSTAYMYSHLMLFYIYTLFKTF